LPKRSVHGFQPTAVRLQLAGDSDIYSDSDIDAIITAAGGLPADKVDRLHARSEPSLETTEVARREALARRLERGVRDYLVQKHFETKPTPRQLAVDFARIERAGARLLKALQVADDGDLETMPVALRRGGLQAFAAQEVKPLGQLPLQSADDLLHDAVQGVLRLHRWARGARIRYERQRVTPAAQRHTGDEALDGFFGSLAGIWIDVFEKPFKTSTGGPLGRAAGQPSGPLFRFIKACLEPVLKDRMPTDHAIRQRVRRLFLDQARNKSTAKKN
jgi:hypothetical protein